MSFDAVTYLRTVDDLLAVQVLDVPDAIDAGDLLARTTPSEGMLPLTSLAFNRAVGPDPPTDAKLVPAAAAVELLQSYSHLHRGLIRCRPSSDGNETPPNLETRMLLGGFLYNRCLQVLEWMDADDGTKVRCYRILIRGFTRICEETAVECRTEPGSAPTIEEYVALTERAPGTFFGIAAQLGTILGGADRRTCERAFDLGVRLGQTMRVAWDFSDWIDCLNGSPGGSPSSY